MGVGGIFSLGKYLGGVTGFLDLFLFFEGILVSI